MPFTGHPSNLAPAVGPDPMQQTPYAWMPFAWHEVLAPLSCQLVPAGRMQLLVPPQYTPADVSTSSSSHSTVALLSVSSFRLVLHVPPKPTARMRAWHARRSRLRAATLDAPKGRVRERSR